MDKELFLAGPRPKVKQVEIDGQTLHLRAMSAGEQMAFQGAESKPADFVGRLLVASIVDEHGKRILSEEDVPAILDMDAQYLAKVVEEVIGLNSFTPAEVAKLEKK